jgi:hypothetical protein
MIFVPKNKVFRVKEHCECSVGTPWRPNPGDVISEGDLVITTTDRNLERNSQQVQVQHLKTGSIQKLPHCGLEKL